MCKTFIRGDACERKWKGSQISLGDSVYEASLMLREGEKIGRKRPGLLCSLRKVCLGLEPNLDHKGVSCHLGSGNLST